MTKLGLRDAAATVLLNADWERLGPDRFRRKEIEG